MVRYTAYTEMVTLTFLTALILGSPRAFIPALVTVAVWMVRTAAIEDRTLYSGRLRDLLKLR